MKIKGSLRRIAPETRTQIYEAAIKDRLKPRNKLAEELSAKLGKASPTVETIEKEISKARNHPIDEMDQVWSIGACLKYNISPEIIPVLIRIGDLIYSNEQLPFGVLSIKKAKWYQLLYPVLNSIPAASEVEPNQKLLLIVILVEQYHQRALIADLMKKSHPDTSDLDIQYFIEGPFSANSILINWAKAQLDLEKAVGQKYQQITDTDVLRFIQKVAEGRIK